jgi:hypothetical protein
MPKPIVINISMLARNKNGSYSLELMDESVSHTYRFELTEQAYLQLREDTFHTPQSWLGQEDPPTIGTATIMPEGKGTL